MNKKTPHSPIDVVTTLMQERVKFEAWLEALDARRASTPANVYDRVRKDYETRLTGVTRELTEHASALETQAEKYTSRLADLADQEQARRDARAEAELRAHVGELSDRDWERTAKEADDALAAIAAEQAVVGADLNRVHEMLGAATAPPAAPLPAFVPEPEPPRRPAAESRPTAVPPRAAPHAQRTPEQSKFDELAFLKSVVSPSAARTPAEAGPVGKPPAPAPAPRPESKPPEPREPPRSSARPSEPLITQDQGDMLGEALTSNGRRDSQEREFVRQDPEDAAAGLVGRARDAERSDERPFAANITANNPIVLRPSGAVEQPKTLKCAECGAMNYPTEWYCERCGAELASL
jgi:hypothetical protein